MKDNAWLKDGLTILNRVVNHLRNELGDATLQVKSSVLGDVDGYTLLRGESQGKVVVVAASVDKMGYPIGADFFFRSEQQTEVEPPPGVALPAAALPPPPPLGVTYPPSPHWVDNQWQEVVELFSGLEVTVAGADEKTRTLVVTKDKVYNYIS